MPNPTTRTLAATLRRSLLSAAESVALPLVVTPGLEPPLTRVGRGTNPPIAAEDVVLGARAALATYRELLQQNSPLSFDQVLQDHESRGDAEERTEVERYRNVVHLLDVALRIHERAKAEAAR